MFDTLWSCHVLLIGINQRISFTPDLLLFLNQGTGPWWVCAKLPSLTEHWVFHDTSWVLLLFWIKQSSQKNIVSSWLVLGYPGVLNHSCLALWSQSSSQCRQCQKLSAVLQICQPCVLVGSMNPVQSEIAAEETKSAVLEPSLKIENVGTVHRSVIPGQTHSAYHQLTEKVFIYITTTMNLRTCSCGENRHVEERLFFLDLIWSCSPWVGYPSRAD